MKTHPLPSLVSSSHLRISFTLMRRSSWSYPGTSSDARSRWIREAVRFAACSQGSKPLSNDEEQILREFVRVVVETNERS